ncbi:MAG: polyamine aminopropyltransferase [Desulfobacteraceae bacterium]|nr:polyamine aminopropyltransferase [Desulfobacteraceae bacterium]
MTIKEDSHPVSSKAGFLILLGSVFLIAACGMVYELVAGAVSSYILGDAVTQFSIVIGVFLSAMGLGSYFAKFIRKRLLETFVEIEIWIGIAGGCSSMLLFTISAFADKLFPILFYAQCTIIGVLIGIEIPLLIRILKQHMAFKDALSNVLALDYIGALAGALLFPLVALPYLGLSRASLVFGVMNLSVAAVGIYLLGKSRFWISMRLAAAALILLFTLFFSNRMVGFLEDLLYQDHIVYAKSTPYQRIVLTRWRNDIRLYLNGNIQFSSIDEARYHEPLVIPAMASHPNPRQVLILGGGDGLAAREVLKYDSVQKIVLVDLDPEMTRLARQRLELTALNKGSLNHPKVRIVHQDAFTYLERATDFFDVIVADLPDPGSESLSKLYSTSFYALCVRRLSLKGVLATQATSPFFAPEAFWCIVQTIETAMPDHADLPKVKSCPYHVHIPSFGEWGFVLAARHKIDLKRLKVDIPTRFLTEASLQAMFVFGKDLSAPEKLESNHLDAPILYNYYKNGWQRYQ